MRYTRHLVLVFMALASALVGSASAQPPISSDTAMPSFLPEGRSTAFLGVSSQPVSGGASVISVVPASSAWKLGLEPGDLIEAIDGFPIGLIGGATYSLPSEIRRSGEQVELRIRDGQTGEVATRTAAVGGRATNKGSLDHTPKLGVLTNVSPEGETIVSVTPGSPAAMARLQPGDLITAVDGYRVGIIEGNVYSLASEIRHSSGQCSISVLRDGQKLSVPVQFTQKPVSTAKRVHLLVIGLSDDKSIGEGIKGNLDAVTDMLTPITDEYRASFKRIDGAQCTAENILQAVRSLQVGPNESIFCYYAGHGAYNPDASDPNDSSGGHFFQIPTGDLMRKTLMSELKAKNPRLTVLITDTCNVPAIPQMLVTAPTAPQFKEPPIVTLLLRYRGVVDISGSSRGQFGWYISKFGIFTFSFVASVTQTGGTWSGVLAAAKSYTEGNYHDLKEAMLAHSEKLDADTLDSLRKQPTQSPQAFQLDVTLD